MQVSQIFISDSGAGLPPYLSLCVDRVRACYANLPHVLYDDAALREFIRHNFGPEVLLAYEKLNPYSYRSDLARYCLLYELGGWYFDISVMPLMTLNVESDVDTLAFRDIQSNSKTAWSCSGAVVFCRGKHPVFETAINKVVANCRNEYYGLTALCPTGPTVLGQSFAEHGANPRTVFGDLLALTPMHANKNLTFVLPDGTLLALCKPSGGGDLTALGATGTNNYNDFYSARTVYRP
jgi:mannosyltransferase OCH1-like enzyme